MAERLLSSAGFLNMWSGLRVLLRTRKQRFGYMIKCLQISIRSLIKRDRDNVPFKLIMISPQEIRYYSKAYPPVTKEEDKYNLGRILDGDWDLSVDYILAHDFFLTFPAAISGYLLDSVPWDQTEFHKRTLMLTENEWWRFRYIAGLQKGLRKMIEGFAAAAQLLFLAILVGAASYGCFELLFKQFNKRRNSRHRPN